MTVTDTKGKTLPGLEVGKNTPVGFSAYLKYTDKPRDHADLVGVSVGHEQDASIRCAIAS